MPIFTSSLMIWFLFQLYKSTLRDVIATVVMPGYTYSESQVSSMSPLDNTGYIFSVSNISSVISLGFHHIK